MQVLEFWDSLDLSPRALREIASFKEKKVASNIHVRNGCSQYKSYTALLLA